jgi:small subunit ribosomal protein S1
VHISELAQHHVEYPREVVSQGDVVNAKIIEVDAERRRLSLSLKRVDEGEGQPLPESARPAIDLSEDVFSDQPAPASEFQTEAEFETETAASEFEPAAEAEPETVADEQPAPESDAQMEAEVAEEAPAEEPERGDGATEGAA